MNRFLWTGAGALGLWLGMPNPLYQLPVLALLYPAVLFVLGRDSANWKQALRSGWLCGLVGASACMYWVAIPVHAFGGLPWPLAAPCALLIGAYIGLYGGLFAALTQILCGRGIRKKHALTPWQNALALGLGWYLLEWLRGWLLTGFPWLSLSTAFAPWPVLLQGASVLGAYGLSGLFAGLVCLLVQSDFGRTRPVLSGKLGARHRRHLSQWNRRNRFPLWGGLLCVVLLVAFGLWRTEIVNPVDDLTITEIENTTNTSAETVAPVPVTLVQGNLDQNVKWEPSMQRLTVQRYLTLSNEALAFPAPEVGRPRLLIWPETAMPFNYQRNRDLSTQIREYTRERNIALLFGAPGFRRMPSPDSVSGSTPDKTDTFNRAYLITAGADTDWYEKEHLVPFGEYLPPYFDLPFLRSMQAIGSFTPGEKKIPLPVILPETPLISLDDGSLDTLPKDAVPQNVPDRPLVLGVLICYETVFPELARQRVTNGAEVFVNISNDAWFGLSPAPMQHLQLTLMRAVEQGRWLMRATNTGISAFIDPVGRIRARSDLFRTQTLSALVLPLTSVTVFYHAGPWLPGTALLLFLWLCRKRYPTRRKQTS